MPKVKLTCTYCDHKWTTHVHSKAILESLVCLKCKDANLKVQEILDTYVGAPPFVDKQEPIDLEEAFKYFTYPSE